MARSAGCNEAEWADLFLGVVQAETLVGGGCWIHRMDTVRFDRSGVVP